MKVFDDFDEKAFMKLLLNQEVWFADSSLGDVYTTTVYLSEYRGRWDFVVKKFYVPNKDSFEMSGLWTYDSLIARRVDIMNKFSVNFIDQKIMGKVFEHARQQVAKIKAKKVDNALMVIKRTEQHGR